MDVQSYPVVFIWVMRSDTPSANYGFELADLDPEHEISFITEVGIADNYTLEALPGIFSLGSMVYWCVWINTLDRGRGGSFYQYGDFFADIPERIGGLS
jgi:hypothetical protein